MVMVRSNFVPKKVDFVPNYYKLSSSAGAWKPLPLETTLHDSRERPAFFMHTTISYHINKVARLLPEGHSAKLHLDALRAALAVPSGGLVAFCVGHSRPGDRGAVSVGGVSEWAYNVRVALAAKKAFPGQSVVISAYVGAGYGSAQRWLGEKLKRIGATAAVELHFNAANGNATGYEVLSKCAADSLAESIRTSIRSAWPDGRDRGTKLAEGRGVAFLSHPLPCVIVEPFFGDNPGDWHRWGSRPEELGQIIARGVQSYAEKAEVSAQVS